MSRAGLRAHCLSPVWKNTDSAILVRVYGESVSHSKTDTDCFSYIAGNFGGFVHKNPL